MEKLRKKK
jgi:hypothetical protein